MDNYVIYPLCVGNALRKKDHTPGSTDPALEQGPIIVYYIEGRGHKILVDTGGTDPDWVRYMPYWRNEGETLPEKLASLGVSLEDIDTVINTHLHWDHCGGNGLFPNAEFWLQKREHDYWSDPANQNKPDNFDPKTAFAVEYNLIDGDCEILPGISVILATGHSPGMQCVLVDTDGGKHVILGDLAVKCRHWENEPRFLPDDGYDSDTYKKFVEKADAVGGKILCGHDFKVFSRQKTYPEI